jgi:hypothetical protein
MTPKLTKAEQDEALDMLYQQVDEIAAELGLKRDPDTERFSEADQEKIMERARDMVIASR